MSETSIGTPAPPSLRSLVYAQNILCQHVLMDSSNGGEVATV